MCKECETKPVYEFTNKRKLCKGCFLTWFRKKFLYTIRKFGMVKKEDVLGCYEKTDFRSVALRELLEMYVEKAPVKIIKLPNKKANKIALSDSSDFISQEFIQSIFQGKPQNKLAPVENNIIRPMYLFLDKEILLYVKLRNLKFKEVKEGKNNINDFINDLEKKHPEIKQAIVQSYLELEK